MEELFNTVLENPFLLIIIIGGIFSFLKGKSGKSEEENKQPASNSKPAEIPPVRRQQTERARPIRERVQETVKAKTVEEHREEQVQRLSQQMQANQHQSMAGRPKVADTARDQQINKLTSKYNHDQFKKKFKKNLTHKGLIDSIVMAEVLGAPRARQQYQSVIAKRNN